MAVTCSCRFESTLVRHGVKVREKLCWELGQLEKPKIVTDEGHLFGPLTSRLLIEQITTANERLRLPPVGIHAVNRSRALLSIDSDSLVETFLVL